MSRKRCASPASFREGPRRARVQTKPRRRWLEDLRALPLHTLFNSASDKEAIIGGNDCQVEKVTGRDVTL
jgi:hypothetical protein